MSPARLPPLFPGLGDRGLDRAPRDRLELLAALRVVGREEALDLLEWTRIGAYFSIDRAISQIPDQ